MKTLPTKEQVLAIIIAKPGSTRCTLIAKLSSSKSTINRLTSELLDEGKLFEQKDARKYNLFESGYAIENNIPASVDHSAEEYALPIDKEDSIGIAAMRLFDSLSRVAR